MMITGTSIRVRSQTVRGRTSQLLRKPRTGTFFVVRNLLANAPPSPIDLSGIVPQRGPWLRSPCHINTFECLRERRITTGTLGMIDGASRELGAGHRVPRRGSDPTPNSSPRQPSRRKSIFASGPRRVTEQPAERPHPSGLRRAHRERPASSTIRFAASSARLPKTRSCSRRPPTSRISRGPIRGA